jgi:hypothetical protein
MTRRTALWILAALGLGFAWGVFATASLDRRAAFRRPHTDAWIEANSDSLADVLVDEHGFTEADRRGVERDLRLWRLR